MALTAEIEARGMKAYEQARAFERLRSWRLPLSYAVFALIPVLNGAWMWKIGHVMMAEFNCVAAVFLAVVGWLHWRRLQMLYTRNVKLLAELKAEYGDELPWIQVENHFAALEELKREIVTGPADGGNSGGGQ
jgi:hypothetical protein